ncbi:hypothetical protein BDC45DRAFT_560962 [Circinella umbellata]|nr:hypothetical protein BDC45DRAFT_560962 [Circinella umbellata]
MNNNIDNHNDFMEGDPQPYTRINVLSQYIRDTYDDIVSNEELQYDFSLAAEQGVNKTIQRKMRCALQGHMASFPEVPEFAIRVRRMCKDHFRNKRGHFRRDPTKQADINRRNRRRNRKQKKLTRRRKMLDLHRRSLEDEFPAAGMDMLLNRQYMSDEESDDEDPTTSPILVLRPTYRSNNANMFLDRLDQLHVANISIRRHQSSRAARSIISVERPVPEELPRWMKQ